MQNAIISCTRQELRRKHVLARSTDAKRYQRNDRYKFIARDARSPLNLRKRESVEEAVQKHLADANHSNVLQTSGETHVVETCEQGDPTDDGRFGR